MLLIVGSDRKIKRAYLSGGLIDLTDYQLDIQYQDNGVDIGTPGEATTIDFAGAGVVTTIVGNTLTVTIAGGGGAVWGAITGTLSDQTDLNSALAGKVPTTRNITVNGTTQDLSADRTYTVTDANLSTSDITTNDSSTTKHGFLKKLSNVVTEYMDGTGNWSTPPGGNTNLGIANRTATTLDVTSDTGTDATVPEASITEAGLLIATDKVKLNNTTGTNSGDNAVNTLYSGLVSALKTKSGVVAFASFAGNPKKATVTFAGAFADADYSMSLVGINTRTWSVESVVAGSFVINSNANTAPTGNTYWIAIKHGEN